jgi:hypothetical protein
LFINISGYYFFIDYIISYTLFTQDFVVPTNVILVGITLVVSIPPLFFVVHDDKLEKFNGLNFKRW